MMCWTASKDRAAAHFARGAHPIDHHVAERHGCSCTEISLGARGHGPRPSADTPAPKVMTNELNQLPLLIAGEHVAVLAGVKTKPFGRGLRPRP
jgi:hypothetical protein